MQGRIRKGRFVMPGVHRVTKVNGRVFKYHRKTGTPLPADVPEDHPRFIAAWNAAQEGKNPTRSRAPAGTVAWGCERFLASRIYADLSDTYRPVIRRHVEAIWRQVNAAYPAPLLRDLEPSDVEADLGPLSPAVAKSRLSAWRQLAAFWRPELGRDVSAGVKRKRMVKTEGFTPWTDHDVAAFRRRWPLETMERRTMELIQWTGCRISDAVLIGPQMVDDDGLLTYRQTKTKNLAYVPWSCPAHGLEHQRADLMECLRDDRELVFLRTAHGKARSGKAASGWFSEAATEAGLPDLSAHGLRKYRMHQMAEVGVPLLAMQSWVGHTTLEEVQEYTKKANRRKVHFVNPPQIVYKKGDE